MTRNKKKSPSNDYTKPEFIRLHLNYTDETELVAEFKAGKYEIQACINEILDLGWKISFSWSDHYSCYFCSGTYKGVNYPALKNKVLSSRHAELEKSFALLARIIFVDIESRESIEFLTPVEDEW